MASRTMTYNSINSASVGVKLISMPKRYNAARNGESKISSGRDGDIWVTDSSRSTYTLEQKFTVRRSNIDAVNRWLVDKGRLIFSDEPGLEIEARIEDEIEFLRLTNDSDPLYSFKVKFVCQPFSFIFPAAYDINVNESPFLITNSYSAYSKPRISIACTGEVQLNVGAYTCYLTDVQNGLIIDSELQDVLTYDGSLLANDHFSGEFPLLVPGDQYISWTGTVSLMMLTPRWRSK